ncbi:uncharacterized protein ARMOST_19426 [Armillaria ostoyae]|uniref:Uncharacterized protein n=1 Tax=Armillaria ostoyae TaxID=47428 RepID=A0A284S4H6_ARMOS|nr:uncharacterized protein ARMOST_19426 [Armillaria ostoyae]
MNLFGPAEPPLLSAPHHQESSQGAPDELGGRTTTTLLNLVIAQVITRERLTWKGQDILCQTPILMTLLLVHRLAQVHHRASHQIQNGGKLHKKEEAGEGPQDLEEKEAITANKEGWDQEVGEMIEVLPGLPVTPDHLDHPLTEIIPRTIPLC